MHEQSDSQAAKLTGAHDAAFEQGIFCGALGAITIAVWFFIADLAQGHALHTPSMLGSIMFSLLQGKGTSSSPELIPVSLKMIMVFSLIHGATFVAIGVIVSKLLYRADGDSTYGMTLVLLFLIFGASFIFLNMVIAGVMLGALKITDIMIANLLGIGAMGAYLKRCHPGLIVHD